MKILEMIVLSAAVKILICETPMRDDKTSSCNHDIDLVIGKALVFYQALVGLMNSGRAENKHKGLGNKDNILRTE